MPFGILDSRRLRGYIKKPARLYFHGSGPNQPVFDGFDFKEQIHVIANNRQPIFDAEVGALDLGADTGISLIFLVHRICAAVECIDSQCDRLGYTHNGQIAVHTDRFIAFEMHCSGLVSDCRKFRRVKIPGILNVRRASHSRADRAGLNAEVYRAGFCGAIQCCFPVGFVKPALQGRKVQMVDA